MLGGGVKPEDVSGDSDSFADLLNSPYASLNQD
jgi:hypothetical protein